MENLKFPNDPIFTWLLKCSQNFSGVRIHDKYGIDAGYHDLIQDVIHVRQSLREQLPHECFDSRGLLQPHAGSISVLSLSGYYYTVALFAILALGGTCVPLPNGADPVETLYFLNKASVKHILTEPNTVEHGTAIKDHVNSLGQQLSTVPIQRAGSICYPEMEVDEDLTIPVENTCLITFTSGTTGRPKGALIPRQRFFAKSLIDHDDLCLAYRPIHWVTGATQPLFHLLRGGRVYFTRNRPDLAAIWDIFREGKVTNVSFTPPRYKSLRDHYLHTISHLPSEDHARYLSGVSKLQRLTNSGCTLNPSVAQFWEDLVGLPIRNVYASTETSAAIMVPLGSPYVNRCIGIPAPDVEAKLSGQEEGELLVKSPAMFTGYLDDDDSTKAAFDDDGFYRTGDFVRKVGDQYFSEGRLKSDFIPFYQFKIPVLQLEQHLMQLPYISEAYVLPVLHYEAQGLAAALVRIQKSTLCQENHSKIDLRKIREDLSSTLELYKLPTLLRILQDGEEIPRTDTEKILKSKALQKYFHLSGHRPDDYSVEGVECWGTRIDTSLHKRPWDCGAEQ